MKRSEMLELMKIVLKLTGNHFCDDGRDLDAVTKLLDLVESAGMRPPIIINPKFQGGHNLDIQPYYINEWESENG